MEIAMLTEIITSNCKRNFMILIVDDEPSIISYMNRILSGAGYKCISANDGQTALSLLEEESIDLLISDMRMAEMSGLELGEKVNSMNTDIQIAFVTGHKDYETASQAINLQPISYLQKPFSPDDLLGVAERAFKKRQQKLVQQQTLQEKNIALREILNQIEAEKMEIVRQIQANIDRVLSPILAKLERKASPSEREHINQLKMGLQEITSPFVSHLEKRYAELTPREIEICNMIKNGLASKEIADSLDISVETIRNHRKNIRKKLGITDQGINLAALLNTI